MDPIWEEWYAEECAASSSTVSKEKLWGCLGVQWEQAAQGQLKICHQVQAEGRW